MRHQLEVHPHWLRPFVRGRLLWLSVLAAVATFGLLTTVNAGDAPGWTGFDNVGETLAAACAAIACAIRARREYAAHRVTSAVQRRSWIAWSLIAAGTGAWAAGQAGWTVWETGFGVSPPTPSPLDAAFLAFPVLAVGGLLAMVQTPAGRLSQLRAVAEGLFIAGGFFLLSWVLFVGPVLAEGTASPFGEAVNLAYPTLDAVALGAVLFVAVRGGPEPPRGLMPLAAGIVFLAVADSAFWYLSAVDAKFPGVTGLDTGWVAGFALIALAALVFRGNRPREREHTDSPVLVALPFLPTATGVLAMPIVWLAAGSLDPLGPLLAIVGVVLGLCAVLCLAVTYEKDALTRDLQERTSELGALAEQLRHQAFHDPLTGLANRALLNDRAGHALARSLRRATNVAVIALDVDAFKRVNDNHGHEAGDELLRSLALRLQGVARSEDTVARIGGDEFIVLVDAVNAVEDAAAIAERLHEAVRPKFVLTETEQSVTVSVGVACGSARTTSFEQLLCDADVAMYAVKAGGRDAVELFRPSMQQQARERYRLQADLHRALDGEELWLLYQPEFEVAGGRLTGFEALVRWNHPTHGLIGPDRFIPIAEESGLIVPLGRWVLNQALRQAVAWDCSGDPSRRLTISINVSGAQLKSPSLVTEVKDALLDTGIDPARVVLEITETALVEDSRTVIDVLDALKRLGVRIAIDDFGTGYASFAYLRRVPVDILKVDRSFVAASSYDTRARGLLEAMIGIGHTLSLVTIGEGIEQPDQLGTLESIGCDLAQGYLLSRPLSVEDAGRLITATVSVPEPAAQAGATWG
jgi:diguanylate cyclase (GGDEF)-like protein